MRHGRGADLPCFELLPEVAKRDVAPDVAVKVGQNQVGSRKRVEQLRHRVMRLNLCRVRIELKTQRLDKASSEFLPVVAGVGGQMGVVVAHGTVHFSKQSHTGDGRAGAAKAIGDIGHFLAERRRRCWLAVRARHHGELGEGVRKIP